MSDRETVEESPASQHTRNIVQADERQDQGTNTTFILLFLVFSQFLLVFVSMASLCLYASTCPVSLPCHEFE